MKITSKTSREELAAIITKSFAKHEMTCVLVGGSVVSIYTKNKYESRDLDFISPEDHQKIKTVMLELGFKNLGKDFTHEHTELTVEFPSGPLGIGGRVPIKAEGKLKVHGVTITLLSPTQCVMDRLAWFFHNNDRQCLSQAVEVAKQHPIKFRFVEKWAEEEGAREKYQVFLKHLRAAKRPN